MSSGVATRGGNSGNVLLTSGSSDSGHTGYLTIATGESEDGGSGDIALTVGRGVSSVGGSVLLDAGSTEDALSIMSEPRGVGGHVRVRSGKVRSLAIRAHLEASRVLSDRDVRKRNWSRTMLEVTLSSHCRDAAACRSLVFRTAGFDRKWPAVAGNRRQRWTRLHR